jgi:nucleoid DNA-binding protein
MGKRDRGEHGMSTTNVRVVGESPTAGEKAALKAIKIKQTKREILAAITEETGLSRKDVVAVLDSIAKMARRHVMKRGSGEFSIPEVGIKVRRVDRKARTGRNPKTGEPIRVPAKTVVRATVLKSLKAVGA